MSIQTNPDVFQKHLPVHTVTSINRRKGVVTLSGSDATTQNVRLDSWGDLDGCQPGIGTRLQFLL